MPNHVPPTSIEHTGAADAIGSSGDAVAVQAVHVNKEQEDEMALTYEAGLAYCLAWLSYIAASAAYLSGITAIISTGALMRAKMRPYMTPHSAQRLDTVASVSSCPDDSQTIERAHSVNLPPQCSHYLLFSRSSLLQSVAIVFELFVFVYMVGENLLSQAS